MKPIVRALVVFLAVIPSVARAGGTEIGARPFGLGVILGDPTGLSAKLYLGGPKNAVDMALAFDTIGNHDGWAYLHATYLWHPSILAQGSGVEVPWHVGVGGFIVTDTGNDNTNDDDYALGVRVPIGVDVNLSAAPVQFFGDVGLHVEILPSTDIDLDLGIGARYYF